MRKTRRRKPGKKIVDVTAGMEVLRPHAAGIDVGNAEHYAAVPPGRSDPSVQTFGSFTADLHRMAKWLQDCHIESVVMQATGVYWMGLYQVLESYGFEVYVVNAKYTRTLPGRKTDVLECQWLQKLHTYGLLNNSFLPPEEIRALRTYLRQRANLVAEAGTCIQQMQKVLTEMNVQLANVLSDLSGMTGMRIVQALLDGQRDPQKLAALADPRIEASRKEIAQSLEGNWREDLLFVLRQVHDLYHAYLESIADCDRRVEAHLKTFPAKVDVAAQPLSPLPSKGRLPRRKHIPQTNLREELYRLTGVDLTRIDGIQVQTAQVVLSEVGLDMTRWPDEHQFASWLGLAPNHRITGGKVIRRGTKKVLNRAAQALRLAAQSLHRSQSYLGAKYRRFRARLEGPVAITAMAHLLARLIYRLLRYGTQYHDKGVEHYERQYRENQLKWLKKQAAQLNMQLIPAQGVAQ
ncbi:MAG TPA: IS110 family transposase [Candidatus Acidoferrales bacterium]|nr:IS110 family transposase [Candidatus Acidoferrales bacterium]